MTEPQPVAAVAVSHHHPHHWQFRLIQLIFLLLGIGILIPWNAFISAKTYFNARLLCHSQGTPPVESVFATVFNLSSVTCMGLILLLQWTRDQVLTSPSTVSTSSGTTTSRNNTDGPPPVVDARLPEDMERREFTRNIVDAWCCGGSCSKNGHSFYMVMVPIAVSLAVFLAQSIMVLLLDIPPETFEILTIISLTLCGMSISIGSAGIVATAGLFVPNMALNPYLSGQSLGGVLVSGANFVAASWEDPALFCSNATSTTTAATVRSSSIEGNDSGHSCSSYQRIDWAVWCYFVSGSLVLAACMVGYWYIYRCHLAGHRNDYETLRGEALVRMPQLDQADEAAMESSPRIGLELLHGRLSPCPEDDDSDIPILVRSASDIPCLVSSPASSQMMRNERRMVEPVSASPNSNDTLVVWKHVRGPAISIFLTFFVTLSLFPGLTSELQSVHRCQTHFRWNNDLYTPLSFVVFNVGDLVGRLTAPRIPLQEMDRLSEKLVALSALRIVFFPLLFLCTTTGFTASTTDDRLQIPSDLYSWVVQFGFAWTNGVLVSTAFVHAPSLVPNSTELKERMSEILQFALAFGLLTGSFFSFPVTKFATAATTNY